VSGLSRARPTVLKIGGSVITDKDEELKARTDTIDRLAAEMEKANTHNLIIVHGGGSFGHSKAQQYRIKDGLKDDSQKIGFAETHHIMTVLNGLLMDALIWHAIPALSVAPSSVAVTRHGRIESFDHAPIRKLLDMDFLPVLYGDAVLDSELGFTILSGDQLAASLAIHFGAERIIMCTDVDGLYDADPKAEKAAKLFEHLTVDELKGLQCKLGGSTACDVTGGMFGKMAELMPAMEKGISVTITNGTKPDNVYMALKRERVKGTVIGKE
jgi:isopentenyl phosphate kinase